MLMLFRAKYKSVGSKKKGSSVKPSKSKSKAFSSVVDPLTGSIVDSDVVYGPGSLVVQGFPPGQGDLSLEFELAKDKIVVNQVDTFKSSSPTSTNPDATYTDIRRTVLQGSFEKTKEGKLSGTLKSITVGSYSSGLYPEGIYEVITQSIENRSMGPNTRLWSHMSSGPGSTTVYTYANQLSPYSSGAVETNKSRLGELGVASFFADGWWTDPFNSNLIG